MPPTTTHASGSAPQGAPDAMPGGDGAGKRKARVRIAVLAAVVVLIVVPVAAYGFLALSTSDAPPPATLSAAEGNAARGPSAASGQWVVVPSTNDYAGYRIRERMGPVSAPSDAVGRTPGIEGTLSIDGQSVTALDITVDLRALKSDSSRRDEILRTAGLETDAHPTAEVTVAAPVSFGSAARGQLVLADVPVQLTLHGVTKPATIHVQARWNGETLQVAGSADVLRSDFGIETGNLAGFNLAETATIEFETTFAPAGANAATESASGSLVPRNETATASDDIIPCAASGPPPTLPAPLLFTTFNGDQVVAVNPSGGPRMVFNGDNVGSASWMPGASEVVVATGGPTGTERKLSTVPAGGGQAREISGLGDATQPDVAADGSIAFVRPNPNGTSDLWVTKPGGAEPSAIVTNDGTIREPRWSADGERIIFSRLGGKTNQDIRIVRRDGTDLRSLAVTPQYEYSPSFTPDGSRVLFSRDGALHSVGVDDTDMRSLTSGHQDANPTISPDGSKLAFVRDGSIFIGGPNAESPQCVPTGIGVGSGPRWPTP